MLACAVLLAPRITKPVCRMIVHARSEELDCELYTDHLLDVSIARGPASPAATAVELECVAGQSTLVRLAKVRGFVKQPSTSTLAKVVMGSSDHGHHLDIGYPGIAAPNRFGVAT